MIVARLQRLPMVVLSLVVLASLLKPSHPFASWFVDRKSSCWIDIRDPTEVVMNHFIVPFAQSSHPNDVSIQVYQYPNNKDVGGSGGDNQEDVLSLLTESSASSLSSAPQTVYMMDTGVYDKEEEEENNDVMLEYFVKLKVADPDLKDLQYVFDVKVTPEEEEEVTREEPHSNGDRIQAKFLSPSNYSGCGGTRIHGRANDSYKTGAKLQIIIPFSIFANLKKHDIQHEHSVDLVAGWACGHEAVTLTQSIVFRPQTAFSSLSSSTEILTNDVEKHPNIVGQQQAQSSSAAGMNTKKKEFQEKYNQDTFGKAKFTANSFLTGLVVFLLVGGTLVNALLALTSSNNKSAYSTRKTS
jgi:hypothetical protein